MAAPTVLGYARVLPFRSMQTVLKFLLVDDVAENRFLLAKTLLRKFPQALIQECQDSTPALSAVKTDKLTAIVVHRASDIDGLTLITLMRHINPTVPIVMVSGRDTCPEATLA